VQLRLHLRQRLGEAKFSNIENYEERIPAAKDQIKDNKGVVL